MEPESLSGEMLALFDKKMEAVLKAMGIGEGKDDIIAQCGALRLRIYEAGEYKNKETLETVKFEKGIDLKQGSLSLHVEASDLAQLVYAMKHNERVNKELNKRFDEEKRLMDNLGFS